MVINDFHKHIMNTVKELRYYRCMFFSTQNFWIKMYYENALCRKLIQLDYLLDKLQKKSTSQNNSPYQKPEREFTRQELAEYDGSEGRPAYVAVDGIVYDVSLNPTWGGGTHFGLYAGRDLTEQFNGCHQSKTILNKLPVVGVLKE